MESPAELPGRPDPAVPPVAGRGGARVGEDLNRALHGLLEDDPSVYVLGEDLLDPYGGAFKITKGLSTRFPDRVLTTPLSEGTIVGAASGLALAGGKAIAEIMFADFAALAFDQILNFAGKSVTMYGARVPMPLVIRCASGGHRGYGPTHSQSPQKHFIGIPGLSLFEMSPFHDNRAVLDRMLALGEPCLLFEDKVLYTRRMYPPGVAEELFRWDLAGDVAVVRLDPATTGPGPGSTPVAGGPEIPPGDLDYVVIVPGGLAHRSLAAMRALLLDHDLAGVLLVPSRLYPFDPAPLLGLLGRAPLICVAEDGSAGGTWGGHVAADLHTRLWGRLRRPVKLVSSADSVIPTAAHLERDVLVQDSTIRRAVLEGLGDSSAP
ncbi:alpha-ketoacid dehydrogenase subunit beta [Nonomuraea diastatica]|uniref:Pyruvate dehydrogenase E1 component subunit beta n=1 Tax=Nonomuraea diastatica TaxID=1848329 RepID=A0A4R4VES5_9ACTN|nr:alpha-ketoacid dehydrogenase subunit beta [Nonomuraea diastatica]TDD01103.1 alpha-ketoacid dehydrogenase subunit beta [Nonomuraea diastatica]